MQVDTSNYQDMISRIGAENLPEKFQEGHAFVMDSFKAGERKYGNGWHYYSDDGIKEVMDAYFGELSEYIAKNSPEENSEHREKKSGRNKKSAEITEQASEEIEKADPEFSDDQTVYERKSGKKVVVKKVDVAVRPNTGEHYFTYTIHDAHGNFYRARVPEKELTDIAPAESSREDSSAHKAASSRGSQAQPSYQSRVKRQPKQAPPGGKNPPSEDSDFNEGSVEMISPEVAFIREWAMMNGKDKSIERIAGFLKRLQMAIVEKRIRKESPLAKDVTEVQKMAIKLHKQMEQKPRKSFTVEIPPVWHNKFLLSAGLQHLMPTVQFIKAYLRMMGKPVARERVIGLYNRIRSAADKKRFTKDDPYIEQITEVVNSLQSFAKSKKRTGILEIHPAQLNGLQGVIDGCNCHSLQGFADEERENYDFSEGEPSDSDEHEDYIDESSDSPKSMTADEARKRHYELLEYNDSRFDFLGKMARKFTMMIHGLPGAGKTTFLLLFAEFLAKNFGPVLYVTPEEYDTPTLTMMLDRLNIDVPNNFHIVERIEDDDPSKYDFVIIDSVNDHDLTYPEFRELKSKYKDQSFINVFQTTKANDFRGVQKWKHKSDLACVVDNGQIEITKSRFGSLGNLGNVPGYDREEED